MKTSKINIGLRLIRNYDTVVLEMVDEPIEYNSDEEFKAQIRKRFSTLKSEVDLQFSQIQKWTIGYST